LSPSWLAIRLIAMGAITETLNEDRENEKATRQLGGLFFKGE
jgi:hypothetical protein